MAYRPTEDDLWEYAQEEYEAREYERSRARAYREWRECGVYEDPLYPNQDEEDGG